MDRRDDFFDRLREEMGMRARLLLAGRAHVKAGQMLPDDLAQEALAKLLSTYDEASLRERPFNQLMALAYRSMKNLVIDQGRKKGAYLEEQREDSRARQIVAPGRGVDDLVAEGARARAVRAALADLSPEERCFLTKVIETDSVPEARESCGWPPKSPYYVLKNLLSRLRGVLRVHDPTAGGG